MSVKRKTSPRLTLKNPQIFTILSEIMMEKENLVTYFTFQKADHSTSCSGRETEAIRLHPKWTPMRHSGMH